MCDCSSCKYTDSFAGWKDHQLGVPDDFGGFANWPRGEPKGPRISKAEYAAHVARSYFGAIKRTTFNLDPVSFYGVPAGMTRTQVKAALESNFIGINK